MLTEIAIIEKKYTAAEYFEFEKRSEIRHEFVDGNLIPMPGESKIANKIAGNLYFSLRGTLNLKVFELFNHDVRLMLADEKLYRYPDVMVAPVADDEDTHAVRQPILLVEVFSVNSLKTDTIDKPREYFALPSLQYYLVLSQDETFAELYTRKENDWIFSYFTKLEEEIILEKLGVKFTLKMIYEDVF